MPKWDDQPAAESLALWFPGAKAACTESLLCHLEKNIFFFWWSFLYPFWLFVLFGWNINLPISWWIFCRKRTCQDPVKYHLPMVKRSEKMQPIHPNWGMVIAVICFHRELYAHHAHHLWIPMIGKHMALLNLQGDAEIPQDGPAGLCICDDLSCAEGDHVGVAASSPWTAKKETEDSEDPWKQRRTQGRICMNMQLIKMGISVGYLQSIETLASKSGGFISIHMANIYFW